jgi:hypothetical protein
MPPALLKERFRLLKILILQALGVKSVPTLLPLADREARTCSVQSKRSSYSPRFLIFSHRSICNISRSYCDAWSGPSSAAAALMQVRFIPTNFLIPASIICPTRFCNIFTHRPSRTT